MAIKGIAIYLGTSYLLVFVLTFVLLGEGAISLQSPNAFQYLILVSLMGIPAFSALVAGFLSPVIGTSMPIKLWPISRANLIRVVLMPSVLFAMAYGIGSLFGFTYPQWNFGGLINEVEALAVDPLEPSVRTIAPVVILVCYPILSLVLGATLFTVIAFASEFGWRGYLLPRLRPLGTIPAYGIGGICWGLWFFPFIYGWHKEVGDFSGMASTQLRFVALGIVLSVVLGQIHHRTNNLGLSALVLGGFAGQACGIWEHLFQQSAPPWTGPIGWLVVGCLGLSTFVPKFWSMPDMSDDTNCSAHANSALVRDSGLETE